MTVLQQSHLCPVPLENQSVYWQYDHALHLYPAPDLVVLADSAAPAQFTFKDTACVNPVGGSPDMELLMCLLSADSGLRLSSNSLICMLIKCLACPSAGRHMLCNVEILTCRGPLPRGLLRPTVFVTMRLKCQRCPMKLWTMANAQFACGLMN